MKKKYKALNKKDKERVKEHKNRSIQQRLKEQEKSLEKAEKLRRKNRLNAKDVYGAIPFNLMFEDGIAEVEEGLFSVTLTFSDISYQTSDASAQEAVFNNYRKLFDTFDPTSRVQLNIINTPLPEDEVGKKVFFNPKDPSLKLIGDEFNDILNRKMLEGVSNIRRNRYLTFSTNAVSYDKAVPILSRIQNSATAALTKLGCKVEPLNGLQRLELLQHCMRPQDKFNFNYEQLITSGLTAKDFIAPTCLNFKPEGCKDGSYYECDGLYHQVLVFREFGSELTDKALSDLIDLDIPLNISLQIQPKDKGESIDMVRRKVDFMDKDIIEEQQKALRRGFDPDLLPPELTYSKQEASELLTDLREKDQLYYGYTGLITTYSDDFEKLQEQVMRIITTGRRNSITIDTLPLQQRAGMNSCLPLAKNFVEISRGFTTAQVAIQTPFATLEINEHDGEYIGQNKLSNNLILLNRAELAAPMGFILGKPGSGKSFSAKREILNAFLTNEEAEFHIIDPANEYPFIAQELSGETVDIGIGSKKFMNPLDLYAGTLELTGSDPVAFKSDFMVALMNEALGKGSGSDLSPVAKSIIDRCVRHTYKEAQEKNFKPTLSDFYRHLQMQEEAEAKELSVALEIYVDGSLNIFNNKTNVETSKRITTYNIKQLGQNLRVFAMLVILDHVYNRMLYNFSRGVRTWLYIDEIQSLFECDSVVAYFDKFWAEGRKFGLVPTGITQIVMRILNHEKARMLLANSDFLLLHKQSDQDRLILTELLQLSEQESTYIDSSTNPGEGLLIAGDRKVPFKDNFPKGRIYDLLNTKFDEIAERHKSKTGMSNLSTEEVLKQVSLSPSLPEKYESFLENDRLLKLAQEDEISKAEIPDVIHKITDFIDQEHEFTGTISTLKQSLELTDSIDDIQDLIIKHAKYLLKEKSIALLLTTEKDGMHVQLKKHVLSAKA